MNNQELEAIRNNMFVEYHEELEDLVIEACEKQLAKYPIILSGFETKRCPNCKCEVETELIQYNYCDNCGQKIDWGVKKGD